MKTLSAKDAKYSFGRHLARTERVAVAKQGRPGVMVMAVEVEEYVRL